jgi:hypothetical protein
MRRRKTQSKLVQSARAIALVMMLGAFAPGFAYAQGGPTIVEIPVPATVMASPCIPGEMVSFSGKIVIAEYARTNGTTTHFTLRAIQKLQGTAVNPINPKKYVLNDENLTEFNQGGATEQTTEFNSVMVRQGESGDGAVAIGGFGDDFKGKTKMHFTFNATGVPTVDFLDITFTCM